MRAPEFYKGDKELTPHMGIEVTTKTIRIRDSALSLIVELTSSSDERESNTLRQER